MDHFDPSSFLIRDGERFGVLGDLLTLISPVFSTFRRSNPGVAYPISSRVLPESIRTFIDAFHRPIHNRPPNITSENALDLSALCDEFQATDLQTQVRTFIESNGRDIIIPAIKRCFEDGTPAIAFETQLRQQLTDFLTDPELARLPLPCLARVVAFNERSREDFTTVFEFCLTLLDTRGPNASVIFRGLDLRLCSPPQICALQAHPNFLWAFVADSFSLTLVELLSASVRYRESFDRLREERESEHREFLALSERVSSNESLRESEHREFLALSERVSSNESQLWRPFPLSPGPPPDGIIAYLTRKHHRNPAEAGIVSVTMSSIYDNGRLGPNALDFMSGTDACAGATHTTAQWIAFDFQAMKVRPTHYTIRSYSSGTGSAHLKSWVLECIDDREFPVTIHSRTNCADLHGSHQIASWEVDRLMECRILRIRTTGETHWSGNWRVIISGFEVFGYLRE